MAVSVELWLAESLMAVSVVQWLVLALVQEPDSVQVLEHAVLVADLAHALVEAMVLFAALSAKSADCSAASAAAAAAAQQLLLAVADATS